MDGLLDLLIELDDAGVCALSRHGRIIVVQYDPCRALEPLSTRLRLAVEARRSILLPFLRKYYLPLGTVTWKDYI